MTVCIQQTYTYSTNIHNNNKNMRIKLLLGACLAAFSMAAQAQKYTYETVPGDLTATRIYTLKNGLKVYLSVNKEKPRIQADIAVRTGSRNDPAETTGLAHYLEHLMFKGTKKFGTSDYAAEAPLLDSIQNRFEIYRTIKDPARRKTFYHEIDSISQLAAKYNIPNEYDKLMSSIGAEGTNAYTSTDVTCYTENIPSNEIENWAKVQSDRFQNMVIRGFHTELEAVYEEYNISLTNDVRKVFAAMNAKLFPGHPYGNQTTLGSQEHLKNPSIVNIKNYFHHYYVPNNVAILMAGDFDPDKTIAVIDKYFGSWKKSDNLTYPQFAPVRNLTAPTDTTVVGQDAEMVWLGWKFKGGDSFQTDTLDVVSNMLSNGTAGLFDLDINQPMKCLQASSFPYVNRDYSSFLAYGMPKKGQSLDEVKSLILAEIDKLKKGEFSDDLLPSVISNLKLDYYNSIDSNEGRTDEFVDAFINGEKWSDVVGRIERISKLTKKDIMAFVSRYFRDNYAVVYKKTGEDASQKKIDKPQITGIPTNRDKQSTFVTDIINSKPQPIQPRFVNFQTDLQKGKTKKGLPVLYVKNPTNGLFRLSYYYKMGSEADKWLPYATEYLSYLGTDKLTASQLKQKFYKLACYVNYSVNNDNLFINLSGLDENRAEAMALLEDFLANAKPDKEAYDKYVELVEKARSDNKLNQQTNFQALYNYGVYGPYNPMRNVPDSVELRNEDPQKLIDKIKALRGYQHSVLYYGPESEKKMIVLIDKLHKTPKHLAPVLPNREYKTTQTPANEILLAPYSAKNIYMRQYHNAGRPWNVNSVPVIEMFNEYYGGGMNTVVFQELRESRALAYNAWAAYWYPSDKNSTEYAVTHIITQNDKMMDCIRTFKEIIDTIPQSEKAFSLAKQALTKRIASERVTKFNIITSYLSAQKRGLDRSLSEITYKALPSITLKDVVDFERQTMADKPYRYMILGDEKNIDMKGLEKIAPIKRLTTKEIFGY